MDQQQRDFEIRNRIDRILQMVDQPGVKLVTLVRDALELATFCDENEYELLFYAHLDGVSRDESPETSLSIQWNAQRVAKWDVIEALSADRSLGNDRIDPRPLQELEEVSRRLEKERVRGTRFARVYGRTTVRPVYEISKAEEAVNAVLTRVRKRVWKFAHEMRRKSLSPNEVVRSTTKFGFLNHECFKEDLREALDSSLPVAVAFIDLDNLKALNTHIGHLAADEVIKGIGQTLSQSVQNRGCLYHRDGDEFLLIMQNTTAREASLLVTRAIQSVAGSTYHTSKGDQSASCTAGIASTEQGSLELEDRANEALTVAKSERKGEARIWTSADARVTSKKDVLNEVVELGG